MPMTPGLAAGIRQLPIDETPSAVNDDLIVEVEEDGPSYERDDRGNILKIEYPDGSVAVSLDGGPIEGEGDEDGPEAAKEWFRNLVDDIDTGELSRVSSELMNGIRDDLESRREWVEDRAQGIKLLGLKIEIPGLNGAADGAPVEGMSKVRHPLLLEAVLRFQANARSEMLPTDGPVKIRNDSNGSTTDQDEIANALEKDLNHYLTATASEYYPDTDRMLFMLGFGGTAFKKVYFCPLRNRPVSESVDADDLIVNNAATDLQNAKRITHRVFMRPSTVKRLQILGVYRDIDFSIPNMVTADAVKLEKSAQQGISPDASNPSDRDRELYECYCELDISGFQHKYKGKESGLEIPYRVTLDASTKEILSIVRNYDEDEFDLPTSRANFVKYTFVPGMGFYDIGLVHILGNTTNAVTAAWREMLDAGMYANFPGFLMADTGARQNTNIFRIPPGGGALVKTGGLPLSQAIMPLPYKEPGAALMSLVNNIVETGARVGGTSEMSVGEGRADAPVGTTLALIEQATKIMNAVHKRMHAAQTEEFDLLVRTFREHPESFWQRRKRPTIAWDQATFLKALDDVELVPQADPNTASHTQRLMKIMALKQISQGNPSLYNNIAIDSAAIKAIGWSNPEQFFAPEAQRNQPPPEVQKSIAELQIKAQDAGTRAKEVDAKIAEGQAKMGTGQQLDPAKIAELAIKKQDSDTRAKAADAKMMHDVSMAQLEQARFEFETAVTRNDPKMMADARARIMDAEAKMAKVKIDAFDSQVDAINRHNERETRERLAVTDLAKEIMLHPEATPILENLLPPDLIRDLQRGG